MLNKVISIDAIAPFVAKKKEEEKKNSRPPALWINVDIDQKDSRDTGTS